MKTNHHQIVIVGGGNAGISVAAKLLRKSPKLDIAIIDPSDKHYYQPAWTLVGGGTFDINKTVKPEREVIPDDAKWIHQRVVKLDPDNNSVVLDNGDSITYDYMVAAPGIQLDWHKIKGLKETLGKNGVTSNYRFELAPYTYECLKNYKGGKAIFTAPNTPVKCGGAPQKIMYLAADNFRKRGLLKPGQVTFYSGGTVIFGIKEFADTLNNVVRRYGIETHFKYNLVEVMGDEKKAVFEYTNDKGEVLHKTVEFDMLHVTPPQSAPDFVKESPLAVKDSPLGWIDVNKGTLQHTRYPNVFALGDATSTPNAKTGAAVRKQAPIVVQNLLTLMQHRSLSGLPTYTGYGSCPLVTGYGKLVLAEFDYNNNPTPTFPFNQAKERWSMWLLKKYLLPWMYWHKILKGTA
ncbi:MAG: FAD-dependent oxidoreductase [Cyclobacteriaceae bacterium]